MGHEGTLGTICILARLTHPVWLPGAPGSGLDSCQVSSAGRTCSRALGTPGSLGPPTSPSPKARTLLGLHIAKDQQDRGRTGWVGGNGPLLAR